MHSLAYKYAIPIPVREQNFSANSTEIAASS